MSNLQIDGFPPPSGNKFQWAPILFHPIHHSPECLIIAVVVKDGAKAHLMETNELKKLACLFPENSEDAVFAARIGVEAVRYELAKFGAAALERFAPPSSGIRLGSLREAEGNNWQDVAERWFSASSAMFQRSRALRLVEGSQLPDRAGAGAHDGPPGRDRLKQLVFNRISNQRPLLARHFVLHDRKPRSHPGVVSEAKVDYAGSKLVANFGTLFANKTASFNTIKRRMWDLSIDMDREAGTMLSRQHEMIVQYPSTNDPQVSDTQVERIQEALTVLEAEAVLKSIRLMALHTVDEIAAHIITAEAA